MRKCFKKLLDLVVILSYHKAIYTVNAVESSSKQHAFTSIRKPYEVGHIGKVTWDIPFIPVDHKTLKKLGDPRLQPSSRALIINPEQYLKDLPDEESEDIEESIESIDVAKANGTVRLAGSTLDYMGRVEVHHNGLWGTVCGFQWDRQDAMVVCRQLGYHVGRVIALTRPEFGPANELPVFYNYVDCKGTEERLEDCYAKKILSDKGQVCNRWRRGATVICGCATETPKFGLRPRCMVSTHFPFDSYSCKYSCQKGYRLEGRNMRYCQTGQTWDSELPRCVKIETTSAPPRSRESDTRMFNRDLVCKLPEDPIPCGFNITSREECEQEGCCFNPGGIPDAGRCYFSECEPHYNQCLNGGRCIQTKWPRQFDCVCQGKWAGRYCQYQPKWTCGRSSWTPQAITGNSDQNIFINMWRNRDRGRRSTPQMTSTSKLTSTPEIRSIRGRRSNRARRFSARKKPFSLDNISNEHLIQILEAGRIKKKPSRTLERVNIRIGPEEKRKGLLSTRIVGGSRVESQQQWPWVVMIKQNWKYICAGVLIAPQWVLTAAHCGFEKNIKNNTAPGPSWKVIAGENSQYELNQGIGISLAVMHEYTHYEDDIPRNDIMMLKLDRLLEPTNNINFVCLPQSRFETPQPGDMCTIAGWGVNTKQSDQPEFLHHAEIPILSNEECKTKHTSEKDYNSISDDMICAGYHDGGVDACNGDSGGPLMCKREDGTVYLPGIISWGYGCAEKDTPGVYTKNANYLDWIHQTILENQ